MKTQYVPSPRQHRNDVVFGSLLTFSSDHPILAGVIALFIVMTLILGLMDQCEIGGQVLIPLVKIFKHRVRTLHEIAKRLKAQFSTWDDPEEVPVPSAPPNLPRNSRARTAIRSSPSPPTTRSANGLHRRR